jgi:UDP-glucose:O-linked fucose beta-1,3-glucosyltransferase
VEKESIFFAVKTCGKYHEERVPVVKRTWARHATRIQFFSDVEGRRSGAVKVAQSNIFIGRCDHSDC